MNDELDPTEATAARVRAAADQFGAALAESVRLGLRKGVAAQMADDFGPGPWLLYPDGWVSTGVADAARSVIAEWGDGDEVDPDRMDTVAARLAQALERPR
jgi:hypothetical protein